MTSVISILLFLVLFVVSRFYAMSTVKKSSKAKIICSVIVSFSSLILVAAIFIINFSEVKGAFGF